MDRFILKKQFLLIYPGLVIVGYFVDLLIPSDELNRQKEEWYWVTPGNLINKIFAYNGNSIWLILFIMLNIMKYYFTLDNFDPLPISIRNLEQKTHGKIIKQCISKLTLKYSIIFLLFYFIDHIFIWSGGKCDISNTLSSEHCRSINGTWYGGFDISGHFCFLSNISLILWYELYETINYIHNNEVLLVRKWVWVWIKSITLFVVYIWLMILLITSIYYHTITEKILGVIMGYTCPLIMYIMTNRNTRLYRLLY